MRNIANEDITTASSTLLLTEHNNILWVLSQLHSDDLNCSIPHLRFNCQSFEYNIVYIFINMHAIAHRVYFSHAHSSRGVIEDPAFYFITTWQITVTHLVCHSYRLPSIILIVKSYNPIMVEAMISSRQEFDLVGNLSNHPLQIVFNAPQPASNLGLLLLNTSNNSRHHLW
jgi:hypothetical protein